jgi:tetratricopeptide (TPR) repeat protein
LEEAGETYPTRKRHRDYFLALVGEAHAQMQSQEQQFWMELLGDEYDNIRAALRFCREDPDSGEAGLRLAARMGDFWWTRGLLKEGRAFLEAALSHAGGQRSPVARAEAMNIAGVLALYQGEHDVSQRYLQASLELRRTMEDASQVAVTLGNLGSLYMEIGAYQEARACQEESLALFRRLNLPARAVISLNNLAATAFQQKDYAFARQCYEEAVALRRELKNPRGIAVSQCGLGQVLLYLGETEAALRCFEEAQTIFREVQDLANLTITMHSLGVLLRKRKEFDAAQVRVMAGLEICRDTGDILITVLLNELAGICQDRGDARKATVLLGASAAFARRHGMTTAAHEQPEIEAAIQTARDRLGEIAFEIAWQKGSRMNLDEAIAFARLP